MNVQFQADSRTAKRRLPFECVALVLQGGGARPLLRPTSIPTGVVAINTAIIAGNEPAERVAKLRTFWQEITVSCWSSAAPSGSSLT
jgi:NTE family protein